MDSYFIAVPLVTNGFFAREKDHGGGSTFDEDVAHFPSLLRQGVDGISQRLEDAMREPRIRIIHAAFMIPKGPTIVAWGQKAVSGQGCDSAIPTLQKIKIICYSYYVIYG